MHIRLPSLFFFATFQDLIVRPLVCASPLKSVFKTVSYHDIFHHPLPISFPASIQHVFRREDSSLWRGASHKVADSPDLKPGREGFSQQWNPSHFLRYVSAIPTDSLAAQSLTIELAVHGSVSHRPLFCSTNGFSTPSTSVRSIDDPRSALFANSRPRLPCYPDDLPLDLRNYRDPDLGSMDPSP